MVVQDQDRKGGSCQWLPVVDEMFCQRESEDVVQDREGVVSQWLIRLMTCCVAENHEFKGNRVSIRKLSALLIKCIVAVPFVSVVLRKGVGGRGAVRIHRRDVGSGGGREKVGEGGWHWVSQ